jgi:hypothetical protein
MPWPRVLGILIVFGIVFMVSGGAIWHFTASWRALWIGEAIIALTIVPPVIMQGFRKKTT